MPDSIITDDAATERVGSDAAPNDPEWTGLLVWHNRRFRRFGWRGWRTHLARRKAKERKALREEA